VKRAALADRIEAKFWTPSNRINALRPHLAFRRQAGAPL
jgi:hypothetical protein